MPYIRNIFKTCDLQQPQGIMTNYSLISTKHMINCVTKKKHFYTLKILLVHDKHGCNLTACKLYEQTFSRICMILDQILNCSFASSVAMAISSHLSTAWINNKLSQILWPTTKHLSIWLPSWIFKPWSVWTNLLYPLSLLAQNPSSFALKIHSPYTVPKLNCSLVFS